jgi:hypothetical protein
LVYSYQGQVFLRDTVSREDRLGMMQAKRELLD